jgi:hypothetical protein
MYYWIYEIPNWRLTLLFSAFFVGFSSVGSIFIRPRLRSILRSQPGLNDVVGNVLSCFCVFYGLLLGLLSLAAYENFNEVEKTVAREAASLAALYRDVSTYPDPIRGELQSMLRDYCRFVIDEAWPAHRKGLAPEGGTSRFTDFHRRLASFEPTTRGQEIIHAETLRQFNELIALRRMRVYNVTTGIPASMWYVVFIGAFINIFLVWCFDINQAVHLVLGGLLSFFIGSVICLIAAMDNPFRGDVSVSPDAFSIVYESLMRPSPGPGPAR